MIRKKSAHSMFHLEETGSTVGASLIIDEKLAFAVQYGLPSVRTRYPSPTAKELKTRMLQHANAADHTPLVEIDRYINSCGKDITENLDHIRRAIKRIDAAMTCIETAEKLREEMASENRARPGSE